MGEIIRKQDKATLVIQWQRIHLPMQEMRVQSLGWEDLTCHGATKPVPHAMEPQLLKAMRFRARALQQEKPPQ